MLQVVALAPELAPTDIAAKQNGRGEHGNVPNLNR